MATRVYYRDSKGRFAGSAGGRVTFGKAGGFARAGARAVANRARQASGVARALGQKSVGREYYVQTSYVKSSRTGTLAVMSRKLTASDVAARRGASALMRHGVTSVLGAQSGHIAGAGQVRRLAQQQRAQNPGRVVKSWSVKIPKVRKR